MNPGDRPHPVKAYKNPDFLSSDAARPIRILAELTEPAERLRAAGVENTLIFFGSARIQRPELTQQRLSHAEAAAARAPDDPAAQRELNIARRLAESAEYYGQSRELARILAEWTRQRPADATPYHLCTGGGLGLMEAVNRGAADAGVRSIGLGMSLPFEETANSYVPADLAFEFHYFMMRKYWFATKARAMIVLPGGFGTLDEFFEMANLHVCQKLKNAIPTVLYGSRFWKSILNFDALAEFGVIDETDLDFLTLADTPVEARDWLIERLEPGDASSADDATPPPTAHPSPES